MDPVGDYLSILSVRLMALRVTSEMEIKPTRESLEAAIEAFNGLASLIAPEAKLEIEV
jgi:hypothetical protein